MSISLARGAVSFVTNAVLLAVTVGYSRVQTIQQVCEKREWLVQPDLWPESLGLVAVSMLRAEGLYCCVQSSTLCNYKWKCSPAGRLGLCLFAQGNYRCSSNNAKKLRFEFFFESASWITRLTNKKFSFATWFIESPFHDNRILIQLFTLKKFIKRNAHPPKNCMPSISFPRAALFSRGLYNTQCSQIWAFKCSFWSQRGTRGNISQQCSALSRTEGNRVERVHSRNWAKLV